MSKNGTMFKYAKIDPNTVQWKLTESMYDEPAMKVAQMKIGDGLRIEGITKPYIPQQIRSKAYKLVAGDYRIRTRYIEDKQVAYFKKTAR